MATGIKTGGRKAGTPNKTTANLKERIMTLIEGQFDSIVDDLQMMEPKERIAAYQRFLEYVLPKQREQKIDVSALSDDQIDDLLNKTLDKLN